VGFIVLHPLLLVMNHVERKKYESDNDMERTLS
jgi:hypothetical protein